MSKGLHNKGPFIYPAKKLMIFFTKQKEKNELLGKPGWETLWSPPQTLPPLLQIPVARGLIASAVLYSDPPQYHGARRNLAHKISLPLSRSFFAWSKNGLELINVSMI